MVKALTQSISLMERPVNNIEAWLFHVCQKLDTEQTEKVHKALYLAKKIHDGRKNTSGEEHINHTISVAAITYELGLGVNSIVTALLHDTLKDTSIDLIYIKQHFGLVTAKLVDGVTKMDAIQEWSNIDFKQQNKAESLRKMMLAMVEDVRVVLIKLCERLHIMRSLKLASTEEKIRVATETLEIFAPLANRLGVWQLKWELEDLSFSYVQADTYSKIVKKLDEKRIDREQYVSNFISVVSQQMQDQCLRVEMAGRVKHIYSIWCKMHKKNLDFEQLYDVRAVRILVKDIQSCYAVLGVLHTNWNYIAGEFDDYIATPKENNYRSIHTAVIGPEGKIIEVQIRTHEMHEYNELGIAAHWRYKEGNTGNDDSANNKILWLRQLLEWKDEVVDTVSFLARVKDEVSQDRIYVFTPKGTVIDLVHNATPIDFAYAIHTDVGHRCRGAKVNQKMVSLTTKLSNAQQVEIITTKNGGPSLDWLDSHRGYLRSRRAKSSIQQWFRNQNRDITIAHGKTLLEKELNRMNFRSISIERIVKKLDLQDSNELYFKLVDGSLKLTKVINVTQDLLKKVTPVTSSSLSFEQKKSLVSEILKPQQILMEGVDNVMMHLAPCCEPVLGDSVLGFITRGSGVTIHRKECANIVYHKKTDNERVVEVRWGESHGEMYEMSIVLFALDRKGLLNDISQVLNDENININRLITQNNQNYTIKMEIEVEVSSVDMMSRVLAKLDGLPNVLSVNRKL